MDRPTTTAPSSSSAARSSGHRARLVVAAVVAALAAGCVPAPPPSAPPVVAGTPTGPAAPDLTAVEAAIEAVAAGAADVARRVDFARHHVARGPAMGGALDEVAARADELEAAVAGLGEAVAAAPDLPPGTGDAVAALVATAELAIAEGRAEVAALRPVVAVDEQMDAVVAGWTAASSRSEVAARFADLRAQAEALGPAAAALPARPATCEGLRSNRVRWAELLVRRTAELEALALAADGPGYDALAARLAPAPFGEDRAAADDASRACWAEGAALAEVEATVRDHLATLEQVLDG